MSPTAEQFEEANYIGDHLTKELDLHSYLFLPSLSNN
jgi:hypothetical protein